MIEEKIEETTEAPEAPEETIEETIEEPLDELEADFEKFNQSSTSHEIEENEQQSESSDSPEIDLSDAENFKLQIFLSLMFALLDGLHVFIYKFISKYKLSREDIALDESDKAGLEIYFRTQKVMDLINRLPVEVIGFIHIEYMYFNKFQEFKKIKEAEEPEEEEEETEEEETEEEETTEAPEATEENLILKAEIEKLNKLLALKDKPKKAAPKKAAPKKAAPKKAAPKKAAPKKAAKKEDKKAPEEN